MANNEKEQEITTIAVKKSTYKKLQKLCLKVESYDDLLNRLMFEKKEKSKIVKASYEDLL